MSYSHAVTDMVHSVVAASSFVDDMYSGFHPFSYVFRSGAEFLFSIPPSASSSIPELQSARPYSERSYNGFIQVPIFYFSSLFGSQALASSYNTFI